jgi:hypothetical protein
MLLSPSSPLTPLSTKIQEQQSIEELLSPNNNIIINSGVMEEIPVLPKERDIYEVIHCLCNCEVDNGFMIQVRYTKISRVCCKMRISISTLVVVNDVPRRGLFPPPPQWTVKKGQK